jgi:HlyD family secretion protein
VAPGDPIASVYPAPEDPRTLSIARSQLAAAEARRLEAAAAVEQATARLDQAARDLTRVQRLSAAGVASADSLEQAELAATSAQRQLDAHVAARGTADAQVNAARAALSGSGDETTSTAVTIRAPSRGRVLRVLEKSARVVPAGTPLVEIGDAAGLEVIVDVLSASAVGVAPGQDVVIDQWGGDVPLTGRVRLVEPEAFTEISALGVEEQRVNVVIDLFDPPAALGAGYRVEARIVTWAGEDVLVVPASALFQDSDSWSVFVVRDGRAAHQRVRIGHRADDAAEVLDGLTEGDEVILFPSNLIADGLRVRGIGS